MATTVPDPNEKTVPAEVTMVVQPTATTEVLGVPRSKVALALVSLFAALGIVGAGLWEAHLVADRTEQTIEALGRCLITNQQVSLDATVEGTNGEIVGDPTLCTRFLPQP